MTIRDAAYHTVHDYPGGSASLAPRLGKTPSTLCHEVALVKAPGSTAKLGVEDAMKIVDMTGDHRIVHAIALRAGGMFVPLAGMDIEVQDASHLAEVAREFAELMMVVAQSVSDGVISDNELGRINREWGELQRVGGLMLAHFTRLNAAAKPGAPRALEAVA